MQDMLAKIIIWNKILGNINLPGDIELKQSLCKWNPLFVQLHILMEFTVKKGK